MRITSTNLLKSLSNLFLFLITSLGLTLSITAQGTNPDSCSAHIFVEYDSSGTWATLNVEHSGTPNSTIAWTNNSAAQQIQVDLEGEYCVTVITESGCTANNCVYVQLSGPSCASNIVKEPLSEGGYRLYVDSNGMAGNQYVWSNGSDDETIIPDISGNYCVTITDPTGCISQSCIYVEIAVPNGSCSVVLYSYPDTINGGAYIGVDPSGEGPFTYTWNDGSAQNFVDVESNGEYCVTVVDANGCIAVECKQIEVEPIPCHISAEIYALDPAANGEVEIHIASNVVDMSIVWQDGTDNSFIVVNESGEYCASITDNSGCSVERCIYIDIPPITTDTCHSWIIKEPLDDGTYQLIIETNGIAPFQYIWTNDGLSSSSAHDYIASVTGEYCVTVYDNIGCISTTCIYVEVTPTMPDTCESWIVKDLLDDGTYKLSVETEGVAPFYYYWNISDANGVTNLENEIIAKESGEYCVTVYDARQCQSTACIYVEVAPTEPDSCYSWIVKDLLDDGSYKLRVESHGEAPFTYSWNNNSAGIVGEDFIHVSETGEYCVTVYDVKQCESKVCVYVEIVPSEPDSCESWIVKDLLDDGTYKLSVETEGVAPFYYYWNISDANGVTNLENEIIAKESGEYCVTVYDARQCQSTACIYIEVAPTEPDSCYSWIVKDLLDDGSYKLRVESHGEAPFTYSWNNNSAGTIGEDFIYASETGEYCVTVYDAKQCESKVCVNVEIVPNEPDSCESWIVKDLLDDGTYKLRVETAGTGPFTYFWNNDIAGATGESFKHAVTSGEYCVKVEDGLGCSSEVCVNIEIDPTDPPKCESWIEKEQMTDGTFQLFVRTEGEGPFTYVWSHNGTDPINQEFLNVNESGEYCVVVYDANQCVSDACIYFEMPNPNDSCGIEIISTLFASDYIVELKAEPKGKAPFEFYWSDGSNGNAIEVHNSGEYCLKVIDANGCIAENCLEVDVPQRPCVAEITKDANSATTEFILEAHSNGVQPLTYFWNNGSGDQRVVVTESGEYCVKIIDAIGCEATECIEVVIHPICQVEIIRGANSTADQVILEAHTSGTQPLTYSWSNGSEDDVISVTQTGEYCVKIIDDSGCDSYACVYVEIAEPICETRIEKGPNSTNFVVVLEANPAGVGPFDFIWSDGSDGSFIVVDITGEYCVKVIDSRGCDSYNCVFVEVAEPVCESKAFIVEENESEAKISVETEGHGPYMYYWDNGESSEYIVVSKSGEYCVEVMDALGCTSYSCVLVEISEYLGCETKIELIADADSSEFKIIAHSSGIGPFKYRWAHGDTSKYFYPVLDGEYCVEVIDANGCISKSCIKTEGVTPSIDLSVYPNPAPTGQFHVVVDSELEFEAIVEIRDINGNLLLTTIIGIDEGIQSLDFNNEEYPVGVFFVNIIRGSSIESIRVVKIGN